MLLVAGTAAFSGAVPALANSSAAEYFRDRATTSNVPQLLSNDDRSYYRELFAAIDSENWSRVNALFSQKADGPLHEVAKAEFYLHANSPRVEAEQIQQWLTSGRYLPQAEQLTSLGQKRGLTAEYGLPQEQSFVSQPYASKRIRPSTVDDGSLPGSVKNAILDRIKNDDPDGAR
ncbi:MAG: hypothetical protein WAT93_03460 [Pontixanthobacter sp.]